MRIIAVSAFAFTAATLLVAPITAPAASISVTPGRDGAAKVVVSGKLVAGDGSVFASLTGTVGKAVVWLESEGGDAAAALAIGDMIARKGFATFVPGWFPCTSGCALAWLAGSPRTMEAGALIGFHGAYKPDTRQESAAGNARVGAYLTRLGLPKAVDYATAAPPDGMTWLDPAEAEQYGITVYLADAQGPPAQPAAPPLRAAQVAKPEVAKPVVLPPPTAPRLASAAPSGSTATGGYVVQVSSQRSEADAQASYRSLQSKFPKELGDREAIIRRADLGAQGVYYRATLGPFESAGGADQFCTGLKTAGGQCIVQKN